MSNQKSELALSTHTTGVTLFNLKNNTIFKDISITYNCLDTYSTVTNINNEYIYIFSNALDNKNRLCIYNIENDTFDCENEIQALSTFKYISSCYDGRDHIYFTCSNEQNAQSVIIQYNINTKLSESINIDTSLALSRSFFYQGKLYMVPCNKSSINVFDTNEKKLTLVSDDANLFPMARASCHDINGNIYIISNDFSGKFIRFNIDTKQIVILAPLNRFIQSVVSLVYHKNNDDPNIILFGGKGYGNIYGNYSYNIITNKWIKIFEDDDKKRGLCGSVKLFED